MRLRSMVLGVAVLRQLVGRQLRAMACQHDVHMCLDVLEVVAQAVVVHVQPMVDSMAGPALQLGLTRWSHRDQLGASLQLL